MPGALPPAPRVLLVEDDTANAEIARIALQHAGWEVEWVTSGEPAVALALKGGWAAMVLDMHLPGMDGFEVCRRVRMAPSLGRLPILGLSALAQVADREAAEAAGIDGYLTKPYRRQELFDALTTAIARRA